MSPRNFERSPELRSFSESAVGGSPRFQIQFDGFAQVGTRGLHVFPLRGDAKLRTTRYVPVVFFSDECRESVVHKVMLTNASV